MKALFKDCDNFENDEGGRANVFNFFVEEFEKEFMKVSTIVKLLTPKECFPRVKSIRFIIIFKLSLASRNRETNKIFQMSIAITKSNIIKVFRR